MSTTYILHGGEVSPINESNNHFFEEFTKNSVTPSVKILMCYWAKQKDTWEAFCSRDKKLIEAQSKISTVFNMVVDPKDLFNKIADYDVLYVAGGGAKPIEPYYDELTNLKSQLEGKVYIGSSMGAFLVSTNYVLAQDSQNSKNVHHGIGILPLNILCHWNVEKDQNQKLELLKTVGPNLPTLTLDECQYAKFVY